MNQISGNGHERRIRVETLQGSIEGSLRLGPMQRTLDDLNVAAKGFVNLHQPDCRAAEWSFADRELAINKSMILFVHEVGPPPQMSAGRPAGARFARATLRLRVGPYEIQGFVHVPAGGVAMARLNQGNQPFISLTSASVMGPRSQFATSFLAVNRQHIQAAQEILDEEGDAAEPTLEFEVAD